MSRPLIPALLLGALLLGACDSPTAPDLAPQITIPEDAEATTYVLDYTGTAAKIGPTEATVDFALPAITDDVYDVRVYFEEVGTWAHLPYTLAGDYCGDLIDLDFLFFSGTVQLRIIPRTLNPSTKILPPSTRLKVVVTAPAGP